MSELPNGWAQIKFGDIIELTYGKGLPKDARNPVGKHPVYGSNGIVGYHDSFLINGPAIIVGRKGGAGIATFAKDDCWPIDTTYYVIPKEIYDLNFAYYLITSLRLNQFDRSTAIPGLNRDDAYALDVQLPPLNEQKRIVAKVEELFSELDSGIESLKTAREQLKVYRQAVLKHAFEGKLTAPWREKNNDKLESADQLLARIKREREEHYQQQLKEWAASVKAWEKSGAEGKKPTKPKGISHVTILADERTKKLPTLPFGWAWFDLASVVSESILGKMLDKEKNKGELKPYLRNINVRWGEFDLFNLLEMRFEDSESERYSLKEGDLVICEGGEPGRCAIWKNEIPEIRIQKALHRVKVCNKIIKPEYLYYCIIFSSEIGLLRKYFTGTTIKHLTGEGLSNIEIPLCAPAEQDLIVKEIESIFSNIASLEGEIDTALNRTEALRQSILKKAFSGQLVAQDPADEPAKLLLERIRSEKATAKPTAKPTAKKLKEKRKAA